MSSPWDGYAWGGPDDYEIESMQKNLYQETFEDDFSGYYDNSKQTLTTPGNICNGTSGLFIVTQELEPCDEERLLSHFDEFDIWRADNPEGECILLTQVVVGSSPDLSSNYVEEPIGHDEGINGEGLILSVSNDVDSNNSDDTEERDKALEIHGLVLTELLAQAVIEYRIDVCDWLVNHGASICSNLSRVSLPFSNAIRIDNADMVQWLMDRYTGFGGFSLYDLWEESIRAEATRCELFLAKRSLEQLITEISTARTSQIKEDWRWFYYMTLPPRGFDCPIVVHMSLPPLTFAAHYGFADICETLINLGADINGTDSGFSNARNPLVVAVKSRKNDACRTLLRLGASMDALSPIDTSIEDREWFNKTIHNRAAI